MVMKIEVYADGSATTKENAGGWGSVVLIDGKLHKELSGHLPTATNNDAELLAAIGGLKYVHEYLLSIPFIGPHDLEITLISDSQIILNWANGSFRFKQLDKVHLYEELRKLVKDHHVKTKWVKGHSGDFWNDRCDKLANLARKNLPVENLDKPGPNMDTRIGSKKNGIICLWHGDTLKIVDLETNIVEDYCREVHGKRGSAIQIREERDR